MSENLLKPLGWGDPVPHFAAEIAGVKQFRFDTVAGRYVVVTFLQSAGLDGSRRVVEEFLRYRPIFDDAHCMWFPVTIDPADQTAGRLGDLIPGVRVIWDFDQRVSRLFQLVGEQAVSPNDPASYRRMTYVLDFRLRVVAAYAWTDEGHVRQVLNGLQKVLVDPPTDPAREQAPVLVVPRIFEPEMCRTLIDYFERNGGEDSGFMREVNGKTVGMQDVSRKRRRDQTLEDESLRNAAMFRLHSRLIPEIHKAYQFRATRIERHIVACYNAETGGYFLPHRDNTTLGTAHRRFAVSLNLNTGDYVGGQVRFPEFGYHTYEAPAGGALVFSCSLLHEALPVTSGKRYVYLPFLYDDEAAKIRQANLVHVDPAAR